MDWLVGVDWILGARWVTEWVGGAEIRLFVGCDGDDCVLEMRLWLTCMRGDVTRTMVRAGGECRVSALRLQIHAAWCQLILKYHRTDRNTTAWIASLNFVPDSR